MAVKIQIFDGQIPLLDEIAKANYGQGLDALDHASTKLRDAKRAAFRASKSHNWSMRISKNGNRIIIRTTRPQRLGKRLSHVTGKPEPVENMESFITSYLNPKSLTAVIAGRHKAFTPVKRRDGKPVGKLSRVSGVSKATYGILQKLNDGDANSSEYKTARQKSMERFKNANYTANRFIERGRAMAMPEVQQIMTSKLDMLMGRQINNANIKTRVVS
jgi:hypothetical protein